MKVVLLAAACWLLTGCHQGMGIEGDRPDGSCGDEVRSGTEACDGPDLGGTRCTDLGFQGGTLECAVECTFDRSGCIGGCGNGVIEGAEQCDEDSLGGWDCWTVTQHADGELACQADCTFDRSGCHTCGNDEIEGPERCDGANLGGADCQALGFQEGALGCDDDCRYDSSGCAGPATCGNGALDAGEDCDGALLGGATCESIGLGEGTLGCTALCRYDVTACWPSVCTERSPTNPNGRLPLQSFVHPLVDVQLALPVDAAVQSVGPGNPGAGEGAATFDLLAPGQQTAGFLVARAATTSSLESEALDVLGDLALAGITLSEVRSPGTVVRSHDDYDTMVSTVAVVQAAGSQDMGAVRNQLVAALLGRPASDFTFPPLFGRVSTTFVVSFATQWRGSGQVAIIGAVATLADHGVGGDVAMHVADAANASGLAQASATTLVVCTRYDLTALPRADIIWVVDESGSMYEEQQSVASNAVSFFNHAAGYSLDFRMGVVDVGLPNNGVLCTGTGLSGDTFLDPSQLASFQQCILAPWGAGLEEGGAENGITQGFNAIVNHLPRAEQPNRIRPGAQLALVYLSDERAQELKDICSAGESSGMVPVTPSCLQQVIGPTVSLLTGATNPDGAGRAYAITGPPPSGCLTAAQVGQGYTDVVNAVGGQIHSICQTDLGPAVLQILEDIIAAASPIVLAHRPISASLSVAKEDKSVQPSVLTALPRSRTSGFDYRAEANGVVFIGQDFSSLPYQVAVAYETWLSDERCANGADDDGDGLVDCADAECEGRVCGPHGQVCDAGSCLCAGGATEVLCSDRLDDDCDGLTDCADPDCAGGAPESSCADGLDNDCDGLTDCADPSCDSVGFCEALEQTCDDAHDNDGDGLTDCLDPDCVGWRTETDCTNGMDDNCDLLVDCADPDCDSHGICEHPERTCDDGFDNDGDGLVDGADLMDCGNALWQEAFDTSPTTWQLTCEWQWGTPSAVGPAACVSGSCLGTNLSGNYENSRAWGACTATSPPIDLTGASAPVLTFQTWIRFEGASYDGGNVKVSADGGATWALASAVTPAYNLPSVDTQPAWGGTSWLYAGSWQSFQVSLSSWVGQTIQIRFDLRTDGSVTYPGWYLDELVILD